MSEGKEDIPNEFSRNFKESYEMTRREPSKCGEASRHTQEDNCRDPQRLRGAKGAWCRRERKAGPRSSDWLALRRQGRVTTTYLTEGRMTHAPLTEP